VFVGGEKGRYPADNVFVESLADAGLERLRQGELRSATAGRPARSDGETPGADFDALAKATAGVVSPAVALRSEAAAPVDLPAGAVLFWGSLALLLYVYAGYPLLAGLRARIIGRSPQQAAIEPTVSIVVVAYNEGARIAARIENLLALDYPRDRFEIVIGSDGSTDDTVARARRYVSRGVRVVPLPMRRGKPAVLNTIVPTTRGEIVVFADARQQFERGTLRALVSNFADPAVGAVSGELMLRPAEGAATAGHGAAFYWRYEKFIRSAESRVDSTIGATGAIYSIRRTLFERIPDDTILDDVLIPLRIAERGYRVVFEARAKAFDCTCASAQHEFARKARTIAGNFQLFARQPWLLNPLRNRLWFETVSHKALRLTLPVLHAGALAGNVALAGTGLYGWLLAGHVAFYVAAIAGCLQRRAGRRSFVLTVPYTICLLSWATLAGFWRFAANRQPVTWERVAPATAPAAVAQTRRAEAELAA
jgi:glycosyltransferase involved in cell wall biosynthesis